MNTKNNTVTSSLEDYLEAIYFLSLKETEVRVTDVAINLNISKPSVNKAINILKEKGYVEHEKYGSLSLTESGAKIAKEIAFRHHTLKNFLHNILGVEESIAEEEACSIEHHMSLDTIQKIAALAENLGYKSE